LHFCFSNYILANMNRDGITYASTVRDWFAVAGREDSLPAVGEGAGAFFLRWPRVGVVELGASLEAAGVARGHVGRSLREWDVPFGMKEDMGLICSELVTNAVEASSPLLAGEPGESWPVGLRLLGSRRRIVLEVWDCHPGVPERRPAGQVASLEAECGRGLAIVDGLSNRWGWRRLTAHVKAVWAELLLPASSAASAGEGVTAG
jgi:anti-sigma regulatory factor (Ser/Thr protein kinase)